MRVVSGRRLHLAAAACLLIASVLPASAYHQIIQDEPESHMSSLPLWHPAKRTASGPKEEPETMPDGYGTWETCDRCERCIVGPPPAVSYFTRVRDTLCHFPVIALGHHSLRTCLSQQPLAAAAGRPHFLFAYSSSWSVSSFNCVSRRAAYESRSSQGSTFKEIKPDDKGCASADARTRLVVLFDYFLLCVVKHCRLHRLSEPFVQRYNCSRPLPR